MEITIFAVRLFTQPDLALDEGPVIGVETFHHAPDSKLERRANANAIRAAPVVIH